MKEFSFKKVLLCAAAAGLLTSLSFSVSKLWWLCFFSLAPLFYAFEKSRSALSVKKTILTCVTFGFCFYGTLMLWLLELSPVLEEAMPHSLAVALILFGIAFAAFFLGLYYALGMLFISRLFKGGIADTVIFALLYIFGEYFCEVFTPLSFPWARLCAIVTPFNMFIQSASLFGGLFVSFIVALINALLCYALISVKSPKKAVCSLGIALTVFVVNTVFGAVRVNLLDNDVSQQQKNAVLVQGNFSGLSKWRASREEIIKTYIEEAETKIDENTVFVIFPETAAPFRLNSDADSLKLLTDFAKENNITLITGVFDEKVDDEGNVDTYNALVCIEPDGRISEPYYKQILVPLGEYVPFADTLIKYVPELFDIIGYVKPGESNGAVETDVCTVAAVICYESIYSRIVRKSVNDSGELIVIISNDSWFGQSAALRQHHAHAILRAVENGRYVLRASSTAITSAVDNLGRVYEKAPMLETASVKADFSPIESGTLYSYVGDIILLPSVILYAFALYSAIKERRNNKK